jgi:hypothetical protein
MARLVKTVEAQVITANMITKFKDGSETVKVLKEGDIVTDLRYIENEEVKKVTGKITAINVVCQKVTAVNPKEPVDYFAKDVEVKTIVVDASTEYESNVVTVVAKEIVEDEGVLDVVKVDVISVPEITLQMSYTDGRIDDQDVVVGDTLFDMVILTTPGNPDVVGNFRVAAFKYTITNQKAIISGLYLVPLEGGSGVFAAIKNIVSFVEKPHSDVTDTTSLKEISDILAEEDEVYAALDVDVTIPKRDDGRITTLFVEEGKTLTVDMNGHSLDVEAYAFYVNGGVLNIVDTSGTGGIKTHVKNNAYPAVFVSNGGTCNMEGGLIDTTNVKLEDGEYNWTYGVVCSGDGTFNMTGGKMVIQAASGISITNGTASGTGAKFVIGGDAVIESLECAAIYLADNKSVVVKDNAKIIGGIVARMGDISIEDTATVTGHTNESIIYPLGKFVCESGVEACAAGILAMTGVYGSSLGNDMNISIADTAKVEATLGKRVEIAEINTKFDQVVNVNINTREDIIPEALYRIYPHSELAELATAEGKTLAAETNTTTLTINVNGNKVYPA